MNVSIRFLDLILLLISYCSSDLNSMEITRTNSFRELKRANSFMALLRTISNPRLVKPVFSQKEDSREANLPKKDKLELEKILKFLVNNDKSGNFKYSDKDSLDTIFLKLSKFICITKDNINYRYALKALKLILRNGFVSKNLNIAESSLALSIAYDQLELGGLLLEFGIRLSLDDLAQVGIIKISEDMKNLINSYKKMDPFGIPGSMEELLDEYSKNEKNKEIYARFLAFELLMHKESTSLAVLNWYKNFDYRLLILEKALLFRDLLLDQKLTINSKTLISLFFSCSSNDMEFSYILFKLAPLLREFYDSLLKPLSNTLNSKGYKLSMQRLLEINPSKFDK